MIDRQIEPVAAWLRVGSIPRPGRAEQARASELFFRRRGRAAGIRKPCVWAR